VLGFLLIEGVQADKMYVNMPGHDVLAVNPAQECTTRISVKSRWRHKAEGFIIRKFDSDFVVVMKLNRGAETPSAPMFMSFRHKFCLLACICFGQDSISADS